MEYSSLVELIQVNHTVFYPNVSELLTVYPKELAQHDLGQSQSHDDKRLQKHLKGLAEVQVKGQGISCSRDTQGHTVTENPSGVCTLRPLGSLLLSSNAYVTAGKIQVLITLQYNPLKLVSSEQSTYILFYTTKVNSYTHHFYAPPLRYHSEKLDVYQYLILLKKTGFLHALVFMRV